MNTQETLKTAKESGFILIPVVDSWYLIWSKDGKKYGSYIANVPDFEWGAANEIRPFLS